MDAISMARQYFGAWNSHDPEAVAAAFIEGGSYWDPRAGRLLSGRAIATYVATLFGAFPDLEVALVGEAMIGPGRVSAQWEMRGTNTGPCGDMAPTGRSVMLPGAAFLTLDGDRVRHVHNYWDQRALFEQLGYQVTVQPDEAGPFEFGTAMRMPADRTAQPGAFSVTWVEAGTEREAVSQLTRKILDDLQQAPGFLGWTGGTVGRRQFTVTAWASPDDARSAMRGESHRKAMQRFFAPDFPGAGWTSVWVPHQLNALWVRCAVCGTLRNLEAQGAVCECGAALPTPHYW